MVLSTQSKSYRAFRAIISCENYILTKVNCVHTVILKLNVVIRKSIYG